MRRIAIATLVSAALLGAAPTHALTPPLPPLERVLLPITVRDAPGAFGTRWTSDLRLLNKLGRFVTPVFYFSACDPPCPEPYLVDREQSFPSDFFRTHASETPGQFLYVDASAADDVHVSLTLREISGLYHFAPIQLPVVRQREFTGGTINILALPMRTDLRSFLRVYSNEPTALGNIHVRAISEDPSTLGVVVYDASVPLYVVQVQSFAADFFDLRPPVAQLPLSDIIGTRAQSVRLEITPDTPGLKLWAFVSITDNVTQAISIRTPN